MTHTLADAKAMAQRWESEGRGAYDDAREEAALFSRFAGVGPSELIRMWETGTNEARRKLSPFEVRALVERWVQVFGTTPPAVPGTPPPPTDGPADDTMLRMPDVVRITGRSKSQIKRDITDGLFPAPVKIGRRAIGWPAQAIKAWLSERDELGHKPRRGASYGGRRATSA